MEQDRFDELAKKVFNGTSRRRVIGGALASVVGAGVAAVTGASAKNNKDKAQAQGKKGKAEGKKGKGKTRGEFLCTDGNANANVACSSVTCQTSQDCVSAGCNPPICFGGICAGGGTTTDACPAGSCCATTPAGSGRTCVPGNLQTGTQTCGSPTAATPGGGVCRTCPAGTRCSGAPFFRCVCDSVTCGTGCCIRGVGSATANDECVRNGTGGVVNSGNPAFNGASVCGVGGGTCNICSTPGALRDRGCCSVTGTCEAGTANLNCGTNGNACDICRDDATCGADRACTGATTTPAPTTPAPTTTTTPVPCQAKTCILNPPVGGVSRVCCGKNKKCPKSGKTTCRRKKN